MRLPLHCALPLLGAVLLLIALTSLYSGAMPLTINDTWLALWGYGDPTHQLTNAFGVHIPEEGLALRGTFVINPDGVIKTMEVHSNEIARDVSETLRKLKAAQFTAANPGQVCPAKWKEGAKTLTPSLDLVGKI